MLELFKRLWIGWNDRVVRNILRAQNAVLMTVVFVLALAPVAILLRLAGRRMLDRGPAPNSATFWQARSGKPMTMKEAARQY